MADQQQDGGSLFADSLHNLDDDHNLASARVVHRELASFANRVMHCKSESEIFDLCDEVAGIFSGIDKRFTLVPGWRNRDGIGMSLALAYGIEHNQYVHFVIRDALGMITLELIQAGVDHEGDDEALQAEVDKTMAKAVAAFMGSYETIAGGRRNA